MIVQDHRQSRLLQTLTKVVFHEMVDQIVLPSTINNHVWTQVRIVIYLDHQQLRL